MKYIKILIQITILITSFDAIALDINKVEQYLDLFSKKIGLNGNVLISQKGSILLAKSYGYADIITKKPLDIKTQFCIGSITKQFTAVAILKLVEENKLSLTTPITDLIPEFKNANWAQNVTIYHLLTHTSGIFEPNPLEQPNKISNITEVINYLKDKPSISKPGSLFIYSNNGYRILGYIIEKITEKSLNQYLHEEFFKHLGMNSTYINEIHQPSNDKNATFLASPYKYEDGGLITPIQDIYINFPFAAGGIVSTVGDLNNWNKSLYAGNIISKDLLKKFATPYLLGYGLGITIEVFANGDVIYKHGGAIDGYHTLLIYLPKQEVTICVLTNIDYNSPIEWRL